MSSVFLGFCRVYTPVAFGLLHFACQAKVEIVTDHPLFPWDESTSGATDYSPTYDGEPTRDGESSQGDGATHDTSTPTHSTTSDEGTQDTASSITQDAGVARGWSMATLLNAEDEVARFPKTTMDARGNALVAWQEEYYVADSRVFGVGARSYIPGQGWSSPQRIAAYPGGDVGAEVSLCGNPSGAAVVAWWSTATREEGAPAAIGAALHVPGAGWSEVSEIHLSGGAVQNVTCGIDVAGNAMLVWAETDPLYHARLYSTRYAGDAWTSPELLGEGENAIYGKVRFAMNPAGYAFLAWAHGGDDFDDTFVSRWYNPEDGWAETTPIPCSPVTGIGNVAVTIGADNRGYVAWAEAIPDAWNEFWLRLWDARYTPGEGFDAAHRLNDETEQAGQVTLGVDDAGNVLAYWASLTRAWEERVRSRRYVPSSGWGPIQMVSANGAHIASAVSPRAHHVAAWRSPAYATANGDIELMYVSPSGESERSFLEDRLSDLLPSAAVNDSGRAVVAWQRDWDYRSNIWASIRE